jgi:hypothetical protein
MGPSVGYSVHVSVIFNICKQEQTFYAIFEVLTAIMSSFKLCGAVTVGSYLPTFRRHIFPSKRENTSVQQHGVTYHKTLTAKLTLV